MPLFYRYYPWANEGRTVFVGVPKALKGLFSTARPFFPKRLYERFCFVDDTPALKQFVAPGQLPAAIGGENKWSLGVYIATSCFAEGAICRVQTGLSLGSQASVSAKDNFRFKERPVNLRSN